VDAEAAVVWAGVHRAAEGGDPLAHAGQSVPWHEPCGGGAVAVVIDAHGQFLVVVVQLDRRRGRAGVASDVGEGFLDDAVGGVVDRGRQ
jgi:hypothetical protein